jgi:hypothetical protein
MKPAELTKKEFRKADVRLRRMFGLQPTTMVILPLPSRTWFVELHSLSESQVEKVLRAAVDAGVVLERR